MAELPRGTVTVLFTDIEGSTRLWEEQPDSMRVALARHDAIVEEAVAARGGVVVSRMGDGMAVAFGSASDAVAAALEEKAIGSLELRQPLDSLKEVIDKNIGVDRQPELFCFGLLEQFDVPQLRALIAPHPLLVQP